MEAVSGSWHTFSHGGGLRSQRTLSLAVARARRVVGAWRDVGPGGRPGLRPPPAEEWVQGARPRARRKRVRAAPWRFLLFLLFGAGAPRVTVPPALGSAPVTSPGKSSGEEDLSGGEERVPQRGDRAAGVGPGPAPAAFVQGRTPGRPGSCEPGLSREDAAPAEHRAPLASSRGKQPARAGSGG